MNSTGSEDESDYDSVPFSRISVRPTAAPALGSYESKEDPPEGHTEQASEPSVRRATSPFDEGDIDADITLRTSDNVEFRVHRVILSLASSVLKDMFSMPQPSTERSEPIMVAEDSETLDVFLRICYPIINHKPSSLNQVRKVLAAAMKYDAPLVRDQMRETLLESEFLDSQPLVVFTIACVFGLEEVAQAAAEVFVTLSNSSGFGISTFDYPKLDDVSAGAYHRLIQLYRTRTAITEPQTKRRKKKRWNTTTLELKYTVNFKGIGPICRPPTSRTNPPTTQKSRPEFVSHPFSESAGDLILRTSDGLDFYAYGNILSLASPTFLDQLVVVEIEDKPGGPAVPIYQVHETAVILDMLLRICYPVPHIQPSDPDTFLFVLRAAQKYGMSKVKQVLRGGWLQSMEASPMRFYFAAVELGWREEAKACASRLDSLPLYTLEGTYVPEMESIGSAPYRSLLRYVASSKSSKKELEWLEGPCGLTSY